MITEIVRSRFNSHTRTIVGFAAVRKVSTIAAGSNGDGVANFGEFSCQYGENLPQCDAQSAVNPLNRF
ncbi:hypothetical protein [Hyphomonas sp.]|uniref:hypothetical protein n=1 Tax=Hyphomonas sp. TaxID=87 RepID=UPI0039E445D8